MDSLIRIVLAMIDILAGLFWANIYAFGARNPEGLGMPLSNILFRLFRVTYIPVAAIAVTMGVWNILTATSLDGKTFSGVGLSVTGVMLTIWARRILGKNYSPCFAPRPPSEVVCSGPYAVLKHPLYVGNLLVLAGFLLQGVPTWLAFAWVYWAVTYVVSARYETRLIDNLERQGGNQ